MTKKPCNVRLAQVCDVNAIVDIGRSTFARAYGDIVEPDDMSSYLMRVFEPRLIESEITSSSVLYFIAERESAVLGYAKLAVTELPATLSAGKLIELVRLYVAEGSTGKGIGGALLSAVTSKAKASGYTGCWLRVWEKNESAILFYERHGFQKLGSEPYLIGHTANPVVFMSHELL